MGPERQGYRHHLEADGDDIGPIYLAVAKREPFDEKDVLKMLELDEELRVQRNRIDVRVAEVFRLVVQKARYLCEGLELPRLKLTCIKVSIQSRSSS